MSRIEWTDRTWNPAVGCTAVSPGCDHCYAARDAAGRLSTNAAYQGLAVRDGDGIAAFVGEVRLLPDRLDQPTKWRQPGMVFVCSMADLFHPAVPDDYLERVWAVMAATPRHTYQVLTKRPQRAAAWLRARGGTPLPNVWLGTSIESNRYAWRADQLRAARAAIRFLSVEPMLEPVDQVDLTGIDWVIIGGESGHQARTMPLDAAVALVAECDAAGVAVFVKQLGIAHGRDHHELPTFPAALRRRTWPDIPAQPTAGELW